MKLSVLLFSLTALVAHLNYGMVQSPPFNQYTEVHERSELPLLNPDFSERKTFKMRLNNGLELLLISDPKASNSAAAVTVNAGSWNDPVEFPGMAHFCEHMLFMGTEKYPEENEFMAEVADQGGATNAMTASDRTIYMFSSQPESFPSLLEKFSRFFIDPLFNPSNISREMHAVDQEFAKNVENDGWRLSMILKELGNPIHPNRMFSCGNSETLSSIPQSALKEWHQKHYSANQMKAIIYSSLKLDTLKELAVSSFGEVPVSTSPPLIDPALPITSSEQRGAITYIQPIQDKQSLLMLWELPPALSTDPTQSASLIAYALNRGQKNNLYQALKEEQLINSLSIDVDDIGGVQHRFFEISMELTEKGIKKIDQVCLKVFQALSLIQSTGIPHYLFQEKNHLAQINYQYQSREEAFSYVTKLALNLPDEPLETYPKSQLLGLGYSPKMIADTVSFLTPNRCIFFVMGSPSLTGVIPDLQEKWLEAKYALRPIPHQWLLDWNAASPINQIRLPEPNSFAPLHLTLVADTPVSKMPFLFSQSENGAAYFARLPEFKTPETAIRIHILSPELSASPRSQVLSALFCAHLKDALYPTLSAALDANLEASIQSSRFRLQIKIDGFSEKAVTLLQEILRELPVTIPTEEQFKIHVAVLKKYFANAQKELAFRQAKDLLNSLLNQDKASNLEKQSALETIQYEDYLAFQKNLFEKTYVEAFFAGNLLLKDAESAWLDVIHVLGKAPFLKKDHAIAKVARLPNGPYAIGHTTQSLGSSALLALDLGPFTLKKRAAQEILSSVLKEAFFNEMRTRQKTGYFAASDAQEIEEELYQFFVVQSNSHQPEDLLYRYELFLEEFLEEFSNYIPEQRFLTVQESTANFLESRICNLREKTNLLDLLAFQYRGDFQFLEKRIKAVRSLSYKEFCQVAVEFLSRKNKKRLAILLEGKIPSPFVYERATPGQLSEIATYVAKPEKLSDEIDIITSLTEK